MKKVKQTEYICNLCGNKFYSDDNSSGDNYGGEQVITDGENMVEMTWIHEIKLPSPGYGSFLDNCEVEEFHLCDDCLKKLFESMIHKPNID